MFSAADNPTLTSLKGVRVGHSTHLDKLTGCTVVLFDKPYPVAHRAYGGSCGLFNTEILRTSQVDYRVDAIFIAGGSHTGFLAAGSILDYLRLNKRGFKTQSRGKERVYIPLLTGAIIYDLGLSLQPFQAVYGREACLASSTQPVEGGNVGGGTGASVGKFKYLQSHQRADMKAGCWLSRSHPRWGH